MFNKITVIGRAGSDPVQRATQSGMQVTTFTMACDTGYGDKKHTDWFRVTVFGKQAEAVPKYVFRGKLVCVVGTFQCQEYQAKDGTKKQSLEINADSVVGLEKTQQGQWNSQPAQQQQEHAPASDIFGDGIPDEGIPF